MTLRVIGAGCGRTGTASLKVALEQLLGAPCYHMMEVFKHPEHVPAWHRAMLGDEPDWNALFQGYAAAVDWPVAACWPELMRAYPDALVLLSVRDPQAWWASADETIFRAIEDHPGVSEAWRAMVTAMLAERWGADTKNREACIAEFEAHNARVRATVPEERLLVWHSGEGWAPICKALGVPIPDAPFPRTNTREDWRARRAAAAPASGA